MENCLSIRSPLPPGRRRTELTFAEWRSFPETPLGAPVEPQPKQQSFLTNESRNHASIATHPAHHFRDPRKYRLSGYKTLNKNKGNPFRILSKTTGHLGNIWTFQKNKFSRGPNKTPRDPQLNVTPNPNSMSHAPQKFFAMTLSWGFGGPTSGFFDDIELGVRNRKRHVVFWKVHILPKSPVCFQGC